MSHTVAPPMQMSRAGLRYGQCRCCLSAGYHEGVFNEYYHRGIREVYSDIFLECFSLFLSTNSQLSDLICTSCVTRLHDASTFKTMVVATEAQLLSHIDKVETTFINVAAPPSQPDTSTAPDVKLEDQDIKEEPDDNQLMDDGHDSFGKYDDHKKKDKDQHTDFDGHGSDLDASNDLTYKHDDFDDDYDFGNHSFDNDDSMDGRSVFKRNKKVKVDMDDLTLDAVKLINRYDSSKLNRLPTRDDLYIICPGYAKHLDRLRDKTVTGEMVRKLLDEPNSKSILTPQLKTICLSEKLAHITNANTIIQFSNITIFKSKNKAGFPCFYCKQALENLIKLREHQREHHKSSDAKKWLAACGTESLVVYAEISNLQCTICEDNLSNLNDLKQHLMNVHRRKMYPEFGDRIIPFKAPENNLYRCQVCDTSFETFGSIERHMNIHFNNYVCEECGTGFVTQYRLKVHLKGSHEEGNFTCDQCGKVFSSAQKLKNHVDGVHKAHKKHKCPQCPERFNEYFKRQKHMVKVHGSAELQYTCNVCDRSFDRRYALSRHMKRDHLEERDFQCEQCPYTCFTKVELRTHMVKHTGERIFECSVCKKSYARKKTLTEHMKIHNNDRRFVCVVCGQAFVQKCSLKGHMKTHHDTQFT